MAYTEVGGDLLPIEVTIVPGKGKFTITGQLGDVDVYKRQFLGSRDL